MTEEFSRTESLLGAEAMNLLQNARVAVFGVGGVGGYVVEALARSGVGAIDLIDSDTVSRSNINRQIIALHSTVGRYKVDVMRERILDINPHCRVQAHRCFFLPETRDQFDFSQYSYVVDAVDTVAAKIQLIVQAREAGVPVISSMGAGNKLNPAGFEIADIYKTSVCPLAKVMRKELRQRGIKNLKVVYSREEAMKPLVPIISGENTDDNASQKEENAVRRRSTPGSVAFVPSVAGLLLASEVIKDLVCVKTHKNLKE